MATHTLTRHNTQSIRHKKLNPAKREFRLLELQPAHNINDQVVCRLINVSLNDEPEFLALSALCGDRTQTEAIIVDGRSILITADLAEALRHVRAVFFPTLARSPTKQPSQERHPQKRAPRWLLDLLRHVASILPEPELEGQTPLRLWVDMLCVGEQDQKQAQTPASGSASSSRDPKAAAAAAVPAPVGLPQIYGAAKMTIGWLGPKAEHTDAALTAIRGIDDVMPRAWGDPGDMAQHPEDYAPVHRWVRNVMHLWQDPQPDGTPAFEAPHWVGSIEFAGRAYFQRRWILEELALARYPAFLIGDAVLSWRQLLRLNRFMEEFKEQDSDVFPAHMRHAIPDLPLGTVHALLDEFARRRRLDKLRDAESASISSRGTRSSALRSTRHEHSGDQH